MNSTPLKTLIVPNRHSWRTRQTEAALEKACGLNLLTVQQMAGRLAGGFLEVIDSDSLKTAVQAVADKSLGELDAIKSLPGFANAAARTLRLAWEADIDLPQERASAKNKAAKSRLESLSKLESLVLHELPNRLKRPKELVALAIQRCHMTPRILGSVEFSGFPDLPPVWRPLVEALATRTEIVWSAKSFSPPSWVDTATIEIRTQPPSTPAITSFSCANPNHEVIEALRWARKLIVNGTPPEKIAIATATPQIWDTPMQAELEASGLPIHFIHGHPALSTAPGQLAAALAEVLLHGLSQARVRRLVALLRSVGSDYNCIPSSWWRKLPEAPLPEAARWKNALNKLDSKALPADALQKLTDLIDLVASGASAASQAGQTLLKGTARSIWNKALQEGPAGALDITLNRLRIEDGEEPGASIVWGPASALASAPRPYTWLLGLTSRTWPRHSLEDPLLPDHIIASKRLIPIPVNEQDRHLFAAIIQGTESQLVCSRARRDTEGRLYGPSPLFPKEVTFLAQDRIPDHAVSASDRLLARPEELAQTPQAQSAQACWNDWRNPRVITQHDGLIRHGHPLLIRSLNRLQSATSLGKLLRDPLGYLWTYGFQWSEPEETDEPLELDPIAFGSLLHELLERTVKQLTANSPLGFGTARPNDIDRALATARSELEEKWSQNRPIPPQVIWKHTLDDASIAARKTLTADTDPLVNQRSFAEIPFGNGTHAKELTPEAAARLPWDPTKPVTIPGTDICIAGSIDRLDLGEGDTKARVIDYKSGKKPPAQGAQLVGGKELQRCLYAFAAKTLLPDHPTPEAELIFPKMGGRRFTLSNPDETLASLAQYIVAATKAFEAGKTLSGPTTNEDYYDFRFALPAGAKRSYLTRKDTHIRETLAQLAPLWNEI